MFEPERGDAAIGTLALVRLLAARGSLPVVAAGGIMDGRGIRAALELGASAVQMGTAFVLCPESSANAAYREALGRARADRDHVRAQRPRLPNRMFFDAAAPGVPPLPDYPFVYDATKALQTAALARGNHDFAASGPARARRWRGSCRPPNCCARWSRNCAAEGGRSLRATMTVSVQLPVLCFSASSTGTTGGTWDRTS